MIISVFVTYNPENALLEESVASLIEQVDYLILIDNSSCFSFNFKSDKLIVEKLGANLGIAVAQNIGIRKAVELGADYIVLSDQDTVYPLDFVTNLLPVFGRFSNICAVVPDFKDNLKKGRDGFSSPSSLFFRKRFYPNSGNHMVADANASGAILKVSTLDKIGLMKEELFIDWVDLEWCWRARAHGFKIIGSADVIISHHLGDTCKNLGFREVNLRSSIRHYYITRNAFYLAIYCKHLSLIQRIILFFRSFRYLVGFPLLSKPHFRHLKAVHTGFWHGIFKKLGEHRLH